MDRPTHSLTSREALSSDVLKTKSVEILMEPGMDPKSLNVLVHRLFYTESILIRPSRSSLGEALEVAGALRERGILTSVEYFPYTKEPYLPKGRVLKVRDIIGVKNVAVLKKDELPTWNVDGLTEVQYVFNTDYNGYLIGRDFPLADPRTGILAKYTKKDKVVVFDRYEEKTCSGNLIGEIKDEEYLVRPNRWLTDLEVVKIQEVKGDRVSVLTRDLLCRPLGSSFVPVTRQEVFNILLGFNMRSSGLPQECYFKY